METLRPGISAEQVPTGRLGVAIVAVTVLCGDISVGTAVVSDGWVAAHDKLGRNRP